MSFGAQIKFEIDDSKVTILTRAARLKLLAIGYVTSVRDLAREKLAGDPELSEDVARLDDIIAWLGEMET